MLPINWKTVSIGAMILVVGLLFVSCEKAAPTQNDSAVILKNQGLPLEELNLLSWNEDVIRELRALPTTEGDALYKRKTGSDIKRIHKMEGGTVGGDQTQSNSVYIPPNVLDHTHYIAVQLTCVDADQTSGNDESTALLQDCIEDLTYLEGAIEEDRPRGVVSNALDKTELAQIEFLLYSHSATNNSFSSLKTSVAKKMGSLTNDIGRGRLDEVFAPAIMNAAIHASQAARAVTIGAIEFAQAVEGAYQPSIDDAFEYLAEGDECFATYAPERGMDWYDYDGAVGKYLQAWSRAIEALEDAIIPCGASVDFLPSQQFNGDVLVTLSWDMLSFDGDPTELEIYFYNEDTELWELVPNPTVDYENHTVSVYIDHFTRYAWASRRLPPPTN